MGQRWSCFRAASAACGVVLMCVASITPLAAEQRVALVIGNATYTVAPLANPAKDARLMSGALRQVGFDVTELIDGDYAAMRKAILEFGRRLRGGDSVGVFYYAGHGVQVDGQNYLIPLGHDIKDTVEVTVAGINLNELLKTMDGASSRLNIAILDACRDNPFPAATRSAQRGLAPVRAPSGTLIAYATGPGQVAYDGDGDNSPYTAALAANIPQQGVSLDDMFRQTRRAVLAATQKRQTPWEHSSLTDTFYFNPREVGPEVTSRVTPDVDAIGQAQLAEIKAWDTIKLSADHRDFTDHIDAYPGGVFAELAAVKRDRLKPLNSDSWSWVITGSVDTRAPSVDAEAVFAEAVKSESLSASDADLSAAFAKYRNAADLGLPVAMFHVGRAYDRGRGVARDMKQAALWYQQAADAGHVGAMASLGTLYEFGEGVKRDLVLALWNYREAAEAGDPFAMTSLAYLYGEGKGVAKDPTVARRWYGRAADLGQPRAMFNLALLLRQGIGGGRNQAASVRWLQGAAHKGHAGAMRELAFMFDEGRGVARSPEQAAEYLLSALAAGNAQAKRDIRRRGAVWSFATKREVQRKLTARGLYTGRPHGFFNRDTRAALDRLAQNANNNLR